MGQEARQHPEKVEAIKFFRGIMGRGVRREIIGAREQDMRTSYGGKDIVVQLTQTPMR